MAVEKIAMVAVILMNHQAMILLMVICRNNIKTKVFLQTKIVTVLLENKRSEEVVKEGTFKESNIDDIGVSDLDDVEGNKDKGI